MPKIKNDLLLLAAEGVRELQSERLSSVVGIKLRRISRELSQAIKDMDEERLECLKRFAEVGEDGELVAAENGNAKFKSAEAAKEFQEILIEIFSAETEIKDHITPSDFVRKIRDESGKVHEIDDVPGSVIEKLGDLIVEG